jgi:uncharacterized protein YecE (DUF72 family)
MIECGVAGWDYKDWKGRVYPQRETDHFDRLEYLSLYLSVFEINRTYYRPATPDEARSWLARVAHRPTVFSAKLPEQFVAPGWAWTKADVKQARAGLDVLHEHDRLRAAILQFAYSFKRMNKDGSLNEAALKWLRDVTNVFEGLPVFVEFRHGSWDAPEVLQELRDRNIGWINVDQPRLPRDSLPLTSYATTPVGYLRMHGRNYRTWMRGQSRKTKKTAETVQQRRKRTKEQRQADEAQKDARFDYFYSPAELRELANTAKEIAGRPGVREVITVNNNHYLGKAPANALMLKSLLTGKRVPAPPDLFREYGDILHDYARPVPAEQLRVRIGASAEERPPA